MPGDQFYHIATYVLKETTQVAPNEYYRRDG
jgi:hypothetical protein